jgi:hypothetical protein
MSTNNNPILYAQPTRLAPARLGAGALSVMGGVALLFAATSWLRFVPGGATPRRPSRTDN